MQFGCERFEKTVSGMLQNQANADHGFHGILDTQKKISPQERATQIVSFALLLQG
jgi:hypothetical protein